MIDLKLGVVIYFVVTILIMLYMVLVKRRPIEYANNFLLISLFAFIVMIINKVF
jgi:hypothetical protein